MLIIRLKSLEKLKKEPEVLKKLMKLVEKRAELLIIRLKSLEK